MIRSLLQIGYHLSIVRQVKNEQGYQNLTRIRGSRSSLQTLEADLAQARSAISESKGQNETREPDPDYVPDGPMYWNPKAFHRYINV